MFQAGGRGPIGRCFNVLHSVLERASNKDEHENGKYELMLGYSLTGEQLWLSDLSTTYIKLSKGSIHEAYAAFGDTGNGGFHHPTSPWPTCDWLSFFSTSPMKHVPRKSSHKRSLKLGLIFVCCLMVTSPGCGHRQRVARLGNKDYLNGTPFFFEGDQTWCTYCW